MTSTTKAVAVVALAVFFVLGTAPQAAFARGGLPTVGGGNPIDCATTIRNVSLNSGGTRAKDQIGLGPDNMHVYVDFRWRPCTSPWEALDVIVTDAVTGEVQEDSLREPPRSPGYDIAITAFTSNAQFMHPYTVTIRTTNWTTGELVQEWTGSIVTKDKL